MPSKTLLSYPLPMVLLSVVNFCVPSSLSLQLKTNNLPTLGVKILFSAGPNSLNCIGADAKLGACDPVTAQSFKLVRTSIQSVQLQKVGSNSCLAAPKGQLRVFFFFCCCDTFHLQHLLHLNYLNTRMLQISHSNHYRPTDPPGLRQCRQGQIQSPCNQGPIFLRWAYPCRLIHWLSILFYSFLRFNRLCIYFIRVLNC